MARKTAADLNPSMPALDDFEAVSAVKFEMALDVYAVQDEETQKVIDLIAATLRQYSNGHAKLKVSGRFEFVPIPEEMLNQTLMYLAVEVVKDLAILGIRVANFEFPPNICVTCGVEVG
jgi:hypothetical protein